jgi:hypothetical protein
MGEHKQGDGGHAAKFHENRHSLLNAGCRCVKQAPTSRRFEDLINSFLFAIFGFMSFSTFYSPQFVLWVLPLICFSTFAGYADNDNLILMANLLLLPNQL